ncbi:hypothetical protein CISIN_1g035205mg [Citrus sinensis]|uniref:Uncharacterized protein n=1 Tax=Citrus sinensis TaxID=2711 RepID=A0A067FYJ6_CITSI|nr:hypothetical protein CISIN_1g035205mg [Citrus sinensis]
MNKFHTAPILSQKRNKRLLHILNLMQNISLQLMMLIYHFKGKKKLCIFTLLRWKPEDDKYRKKLNSHIRL